MNLLKLTQCVLLVAVAALATGCERRDATPVPPTPSAGASAPDMPASR